MGVVVVLQLTIKITLSQPQCLGQENISDVIEKKISIAIPSSAM